MNIEIAVIDHLKERLGTESVYGEVPENPEEEFYVVDKTAGGREDRLNAATIAVQSYGPTKYRASEMNEGVKAAMEYLPTVRGIASCHLNTDYNFTNPETKQNRYQAVFDITHF